MRPAETRTPAGSDDKGDVRGVGSDENNGVRGVGSDDKDDEVRGGGGGVRTRGPLWLIGMMGTGKSRVGRVLAERLGWRFIDMDEAIAAEAGQSITELFAAEGEPAFRARERALAARLCHEATDLAEAASSTRGLVIATGGGAPCIAGVMDQMKSVGLVAWLSAETDEVMTRINPAERPLLRSGSVSSSATRAEVELHAVDRWRSIAADRAPCYARADVRIHRRGREAGAVAEELVAWLRDYGDAAAGAPCRETMVVSLGDRSYPLFVDAGHPGAEARFAALLARQAPPGRTRIGLVTDETVAALHLPRYRAALQQRGYALVEVVVPDGERSKSLAEAERVASLLASGGLDRQSVVVALGGGVVGDLAGFVASTLFRGVACAQLPSTLLAMVDSSVGGKTGVNLPLADMSAADGGASTHGSDVSGAAHSIGKNLVGSFHQPRLVFADLGSLRTLPARELSSGLAEVAKHALLDGEAQLAQLEATADAARRGEAGALEPLILASCALKSRVVQGDERELYSDGGRALLNLGHTLGHALEAASHATPPAASSKHAPTPTPSSATATRHAPLRHGEAVALGLLAAARVGAQLFVDATPALEARIAALLDRLGLPTDLDARLDAASLPSLIALMATDKKRAGSTLRYVALPRAGGAQIVPVTLERLAALLAARDAAPNAPHPEAVP